ncbi:Calx-beta domain-containing protein [Ruegeria sp.]|uniref:Calx-beta domain-containing protein n=1 Tax=Ruegeria sp. TaxID=1879320 RepID=UPI003C7BA7D5
MTLTQPTNTDVTVDTDTVTSNNQTTLSFTTVNWNQPQTVTVAAAQDVDAAVDSADILHSASGGGYASVTGTVSVTVEDDDEAALVFAQAADPLAVSEGGSAAYTVALATQPTATVTVTLTQPTNTDVTVDTDTITSNNQTTLSFTTANWNQPQTVTVAAAQDVDAAVDSADILHSASGGGYASVTGTVSVTVTDDDEAALVFAQAADPLEVSEGGSAAYTVALATQPTATVTVTLTQPTNTDVTVDTDTVTSNNQTTLSFTTVNWNAPQTVTVAAAQDVDAAVDSADILHSASGGGYASVSGTVRVTVSDDDEAALVFAQAADPLEVSEGGSAAYTVALATQPTGTVTVTLTQPTNTDVTVDTDTVTSNNQTTLSFTTVNWNAPQTVTVAAAQDVDAAVDSADILHSASGGGYASVTGTVSVTVTDDDEAALVFAQAADPLEVSEGGSATYTVALATQPTGTVTVTLTQPTNTDVTVDTDTVTSNNQTTLSFTTVNWNAPQTVTVAAAQDVDAAVDSADILHSASGGGYASVTGTVSVTVTDDDEAAVGFVEAASTVPERAGTHEVTLRFDVVSAAPLELRYSLSGTATAGRDFTAGDGVLRVPAQAREVTLPVTILDDGEQEADETVVVTLIEDRGGQYRLGSTTTHTLTITDDDSDLAERVVRPALARFGRTVGEQVLDAVTDRLGAARTPGFEGRFAGEALPDVICDDGKSAPDHVLEDDDRRRNCVGQGRYEPGSGRPADPSVAAWSNGLTGGPGGTPEVQAKETSDILPGTSFALTSETENGAALAFWGRGAQSGFSGRAGDLGLEGEVTSFMLGADQARDDWLFGLMLSRSRGEIDYTLGEASGEMETDLTALVPYMGWDVSDRLSVWGAAGLGSGDMRLRPEDGSEFRTDIDWGMAAAGADGALGSVAALGGAELRWLADALWTRTTSDAVPGLEATSGSTTRLRLGLESRWEHSFASAATLSPRLETGLRYDGGDAETGFGLEVGGGVEFTDPSRGLSLGLRGRTLALHQDGNFEDWGLALDLAYDPTPETKRGFAARLSHTFGGASSGGVDALLGPRLFPEASPTGGGDRSWSVEAAYGVSRGRGRVGSPYTTITAAGSGSATGARLGYRIEPDADHAADVNLDFWTEPPTAANDRASGGATLQWKW